MPNPNAKIKVYRPTLEEMANFPRYLEYMESDGAHLGGIGKIIPPDGYYARSSKNYDDIDSIEIESPIKQIMHGQKGMYTTYNVQQNSMTVKEFRDLANRPEYATPVIEEYTALDRSYWKNVAIQPPIYAADVSGSLFDEDQTIWNVSKLGSILDTLKEYSNAKIEGVNTSYLYFGMWKATFPWHTEDKDLHSINYLHFGCPKVWYSVPPEHGKRLEELIRGFFPQMQSKCKGFIRHKMSVLSPTILDKYGIPYNTVVQESGQFIVTFPFGYHCGYNIGFNCAESTNFATERWINYGKHASRCSCRSDAVSITMDPFIKLFQTPEEYNEWRTNRKATGSLDHTWCPPPPLPEGKGYISWRTKIENKLMLVNQAREKFGMSKLTVKQFLKPSTPVEVGVQDDDDDDDEAASQRSESQRSESQRSESQEMEGDSAGSPEYDLVGTLYDRVKSRGNRQSKKGHKKNGVNSSNKQESSTGNVITGDEVFMRLQKVQSRVREEDKALEPVKRAGKRGKTKSTEEARLNLQQGEVAPYCSVCYVVKAKAKITAIFGGSVRCNKLFEDETSRFLQSDVLIPEINFEMKHMNPGPEIVADYINKQPCVEVSPLLDCSKCNLRIHAKCWGLSEEELQDLEEDPDKEWVCDRCQDGSRRAICFICNKKTGALKKVTGSGSKWAHLECVLATPGACFEDVKKRRGINAEKLTNSKSRKHQCIYCRESTQNDGGYGHAIRCPARICTKVAYFHVTCARDNDHLIEGGDWPDALYVYCKDCGDGLLKEHQRKEKVPSLNINDKVMVKTGSGRPPMSAVVTGIKSVTNHKAYFEDGSFSGDVYQEHIIDHDWRKYPELGSRISVKWSDGRIYSATYHGFSIAKLYEVQYASGGICDFTRDDIYGPGEQPRKYRKKSNKKAKKRKTAEGLEEEEDASMSASTSNLGKNNSAKSAPSEKKTNNTTSKSSLHKKKAKHTATTPNENNSHQSNGDCSD